jgi:F-type H+-transporting ATPase subunit b
VNDLDEAQKLKENAEKKLNEYNKIIEESKKEAKKIIEDNKKKLDRDIEKKKHKFNEEIERELVATEEEIKDLKKSSISNISNIAAETSAEVIKQIINIEVNKSSATAIVNDIVKRKVEKHT